LIEDLHWADPSTVDLLREMVATQASQPVLLVCTTRPEFSAPGFASRNCQEIAVDALSADDVRALVASIAGPKRLPAAVREEVVARAGGIPLFVEAVTHTVLEAGILRELEDRYELTGPLPQGLIPSTLHDSLMARIDRLGPDRHVAQLAATIGRESGFDLLQAVLEQPSDALIRSLRHLVELELVIETGEPPASKYTFKHALIQDAAYESLLRKTRQQFHRRIVEVLLDRYPDAKPDLLARHYEGAGQNSEAIACWMKAGHQAQQHLALRESGAHMQKAISLLRGLPEDDVNRLQAEMEAQLVLVRSMSVTMGWGAHELESAYRRSGELCRRLGNASGVIETAGRFSGMHLVRGDIRKAGEEANTMLDMALAAGEPVVAIASRHVAGYAAYFSGNFPLARVHGEGGFALYTPDRERAVASGFNSLPSSFACGNILALGLWFLGYPDQSERASEAAWRTNETLGIDACTAFALAATLMLDYTRRDLKAIEGHAERLAKLAQDGGYFYYSAIAGIYSGWVHAMNGDVEAGISEMNLGLEALRATSTGLMTPQYSLMIAEAERRSGRLEKALTAISAGLAHAAENGEHAHESELHRLRGEVLLDRGDSVGGEASLRRAIEIAEAQQAKMAELRAALSLAKLRQSQGRIGEAIALLQPLDEWFQEGRQRRELIETRALLDSLISQSQAGPSQPLIKTQDAGQG
jgi:predicted ATPase